MRHLAKVGQARHQHHRGLADAEEQPFGGGVGDAPARPPRQVDRYMVAIVQSVELQRRRFSVDADAGGDSEAGSRDDHGTIRSPAGLERGARFQCAGIEQGDAGAAAVGDEDLSVVGDGAGHAGKSRQRRKVPAGVVVDHLDAVARGVRDEDAPALRIEGGVIKLAARGAWYGDGSDCFQRHDDLTELRALSVALKKLENGRKTDWSWIRPRHHSAEPRYSERSGFPACARQPRSGWRCPGS